MTRQEGMVRQQEDLQELEIDGTTFVREQDNDYGPRWKVFESGSWEESKHAANEYGTIENYGWGSLSSDPTLFVSIPSSG